VLLAELADTRTALKDIWMERVSIAEALPAASAHHAHQLRLRDVALLECEVAPTWRAVELEFQLTARVLFCAGAE